MELPRPSDDSLSAAAGDSLSVHDMFPRFYSDLRRIAESELQRLPPGQTLQATALVHEVWLRLAQSGASRLDRGHFLALAARAIRQIVIDNARRKGARKRAGGRLRIELRDLAISTDVPADDLLALDEALDELSRHSNLAAQIVNLRYFAGASVEVVADLIGISKRTVEREWEYARAWLHARIYGSVGDAEPGVR